jgi:hypothetical protein
MLDLWKTEPMIFWDGLCLWLISIPSIMLGYLFWWFQMSWELCLGNVFEKGSSSIQSYKMHICMMAWPWCVLDVMSMSIERNH